MRGEGEREREWEREVTDPNARSLITSNEGEDGGQKVDDEDTKLLRLGEITTFLNTDEGVKLLYPEATDADLYLDRMLCCLIMADVGSNSIRFD